MGNLGSFFSAWPDEMGEYDTNSIGCAGGGKAIAVLALWQIFEAIIGTTEKQSAPAKELMRMGIIARLSIYKKLF